MKIDLLVGKGYAFIFVPEPFVEHVIGYNGIEFNNQKIKVEVAKSKDKAPSASNTNGQRLYSRGRNNVNQRRNANYRLKNESYEYHSQFLKPLVVPPKELLHAIDVVNLTNQM